MRLVAPKPARLPPEKILALHVALGALILIAAAWLFGAIAEDVVNHDAFLGGIDIRVARWLHARATPALTSTMIFISYLGAPLATIVIGLASAVFFLWQRQRYAFLALVLAVPGGALLNVITKYAIARHRPTFADPILTLTSYSFPSGHALGSTVLYGVLAAVAVWTVTNRRWRVLTVASASLLIVLVSFSRIYLGVHYLSDVVAGVLGGIVWLALCLFVVTTFRRRRMSGGDR